jgi:hypothetical protein
MGMFQSVSLLRNEYDLGWLYAAGAGYFTALALAA